MLKFIIAPLLGGVIGYITNDLAIRMLFRPRRALYIGKFHIPFTPGLIPSQKGRIAQSIGAVISTQLLNEETLKETLLSEKTIASLQEKVRRYVQGFASEERTIGALLEMHYDPRTLSTNMEKLKQKLTEIICAKIDEAKVGYAIVESLTGNLAEQLAQNKLLAMFMDHSAQEAFKRKIADRINDIISDKAPDAIASFIDRQQKEIFNTRVCDLYMKYRDREDWLIEQGTELYVSVLGGNMEKLLRAVNIEQIVVDKINAFDAAQLEAMIFGIMKKELNAIVYLGAVLGFFMGFINLLF